MILDRAYIERIRQARGYGVNPWITFPRFPISHRLLIDGTYVASLRAWLDNLRPGPCSSLTRPIMQAHCWNLFHFDVPWNPARLEQRNGRIDRKLQPNPEVFCHYFVYTQRPEDRVLGALVRKTETIARELGSLSPVISNRLATVLKGGISRGKAL